MTSAKWWRADGGYQDVPEERQQPDQANMCLCQGFGRGVGPGYEYTHAFNPTFAPWMMPQTSFIRGPIGIAGLSSPPPPPPYAPLGGPAPVCAPPIACAPPEPEKKDKNEEKNEEKKKKKQENLWAPPKLPDGANYMFDGEHTTIHIFRKAAAIWTEKYRGQELYVVYVPPWLS